MAKKLSDQAKQHAAAADQWNQRASEFILRENNSERVPSDTIDLHGQYVKEAEDILRKRIEEGRRTNQTHLHVIVGKGIHSADHVQKIKPAVEQKCNELGLAHQVEHNEGRIYIDLTGNQQLPQHPPQPGQGYHGGGGYPSQQGGYQQPHHQPHHQQQQQQDEKDTGCFGIIIAIIKAILGKK
jgi:hypothetical protein